MLRGGADAGAAGGGATSCGDAADAVTDGGGRRRTGARKGATAATPRGGVKITRLRGGVADGMISWGDRNGVSNSSSAEKFTSTSPAANCAEAGAARKDSAKVVVRIAETGAGRAMRFERGGVTSDLRQKR